MATDYVWIRRNTNTLWFSMAVPREFQALAGRKVIQKSLGTSDRREASIKAGEERARLFRRWGAISPSAAPPSIPALAMEAHTSMLDAVEERRRGKGADGATQDQYLADRAADLRRFSRQRLDGDYGEWEGVADRMIANRSLPIAKESSQYRDLVDALAEAGIDTLSVFLRRHTGEIDASPTSKILTSEIERAKATAAPGATIMELFDAYAASKVAEKKKRSDGVAQDRMVIQLFAGLIGPSRDVASITFDCAKRFVDLTAMAPKGFAKRKGYRGLTLAEAVEKGKRDGDQVISRITHQRYISTVSPFFDWLSSEKGGRRVSGNPFNGLHNDISLLRQANPRPPFRAAEIAQIVNSPLFTGFLRDGSEHLPGNQTCDNWRRWIPLVAIFTGARVGEIAQLRVDDVFIAAGMWCVEFRHDEKAGQKTKSGKSRIIPLHTKLVQAGFVDFSIRQQERSVKDGNTRLFADLKPDGREQYGTVPARWLRKYLDNIGLVGAGMGGHSFRHTIADQLRVAGYVDSMIGPLVLGHSVKSVTGGYGEIPQGSLYMKRDMIEAVEFLPLDGRGLPLIGGQPVDFSHLFRFGTEATKAAPTELIEKHLNSRLSAYGEQHLQS